MPARNRVAALDGVRGVAAVVVLIHHALLVAPGIADRYKATHPGRMDGTWWLTYTPLHLFRSGTEAVFVFFVLSGLVLTLPWSQGRGQRWLAYYPSRLLRLYLPVWASLIFAMILIKLVDRTAVPNLSWWLNIHATGAHGAGEGIREATLAKPGWVSSPLWSLKWEVIFSLLLPVYVYAGKLAPKLWPAKLVVVFAVMVYGVRSNHGALVYMPIFALGTLMAFHRHSLTHAVRRISHPTWAALTVLCLVLLDASWYVKGADLGRDAVAVATGLETFAAAGCVFIAMSWTRARRQLARPAAKWLGARSFSLYLVHEPIIVTMAFAMHGNPPTAVMLLVAVTFSLPAAEVFYRLVEQPSLNLAKHVRRRIEKPRHAPLLAHRAERELRVQG